MRPVCEKYWRQITIEPTYFLFHMASAMTDFFNVNLYLQKACRFDRFFEPDLSTPCDDEKRGETYVADVLMTSATLGNLVSLTVCIFFTSYSDLAGRKRKPFVIVVLCGLLMQSASAMLQSYFWSWPPLLGIVLNYLLPDSCGGWMTMMVFSVLLIYDKTKTGDRHVMLTAAVCLRALGTIIGKGVAGHLLHAIGFFYSFTTCFLLQALAMGCALVLIPPDACDKVVDKYSSRQIFSLKKTGESLKLILWPKEKSAKHKAAINLLMLLSMLVYFHFIGSMTCTFVMSKWFKLHDSIIGNFTSFMDTLAVIAYFFATEDWHLYLAPLLDVFHGVALSTCFSLVSKFFTEKEFGRLLAVHTLFNLGTAFSFKVYSHLFKTTMDTFPNAIFLLSIILNAGICIIYSITYFLSKDLM